MDLKMIKKHNKNITDVLKIVYPNISHYRIDTLKEFGYIQNVNEIFFQKSAL